MQIGEMLAIDVEDAAAAPPKASLTVIVRERSSEEPLEGVQVTLSGGAGKAKTDASGTAKFSGIAPGAYTITLKEYEFELTPETVEVVLTSGEEERREIDVKRVMLTLTIKRIHIRGLLKAARGDKGELEYGHWWIEIDNGAQSYGWWPAEGVGIAGTFLGVKGILNGQTPRFGGTPTSDPHEGDTAEEMFHPRVESGQSRDAIKSAIRAFARAYHGKWSWPWGQNCHSFQEAMMKQCKLTKNGSKPAT